MTIPGETTAITYGTRHCTVNGCGKCIARARWRRRKKSHSRKNSIRRINGKK
jgi:hypothetical protein